MSYSKTEHAYTSAFPALVGKSQILKGTPNSRILNVEELLGFIDPNVLPVLAQMAAQSPATSLRQISIEVFENNMNLRDCISKSMPCTVEAEDSVKAF